MLKDMLRNQKLISKSYKRNYSNGHVYNFHASKPTADLSLLSALTWSIVKSSTNSVLLQCVT